MRRKTVLKVRLSDAELARLDGFRRAYGFPTRAGAMRALLSGAEPPEITTADSPLPGPSLDTLLEAFRQGPRGSRPTTRRTGMPFPIRTLTRQVDPQAPERAMVKFNEKLNCFHVDLFKQDEEKPWLILAIRHDTGEVIAQAHGEQKNRDAWPPVAEALGMKA